MDTPGSHDLSFSSFHDFLKEMITINYKNRALTGVGAGLLEWGVTSPSEAVYVCLLVFNQSGDGLESFSGACRSRKCLG